mmetsp:Transcript_10576/g.14849  ORF Transcript_10576/g.14849 Transcript_10576/m.14849 type:complete len:120 (-) Transcript_10576:489-848(-)
MFQSEANSILPSISTCPLHDVQNVNQVRGWFICLHHCSSLGPPIPIRKISNGRTWRKQITLAAATTGTSSKELWFWLSCQSVMPVGSMKQGIDKGDRKLITHHLHLVDAFNCVFIYPFF